MRATVLVIQALLCLGGAFGRVYYVHPSGSDAGPATYDAPLATVQQCVDALTAPGDECRLKAGTYRTGATVNVAGKQGVPGRPFVIAGAGDGAVVLDGTTPIPGPWVQESTASHIFSTRTPFPVVQIFAGDIMLTPARWPNALWSDRTAFMGPEHWAHSSKGEHDVDSGKGVLQDAGACNSTADCCSLCNANSLAESGINATGAVAVLNLWADGTGVQRIREHTPGSDTLLYDATWCKAEIARRGKCGDGYHDGVGRYFLEGPRALLDQAEEWSFEQSGGGGGGQLFLWAPGGVDPSTLGDTLRAKTQTYAFDVRNSSFVTFANMSFFATSLQAYDDVNVTSGNGQTLVPAVTDLTFESLDFDFPAASRRMLGDLSPIPSMAVWTDARNKGVDADATTRSGTGASADRAEAEGCYKELSGLCHDDARTMNETLCLACASRVAPSFSVCTAQRAAGICTNPRPACLAALGKQCKAGAGASCVDCASQHAAELSPVNCSASDIDGYCKYVVPTPPPAPTPQAPSGPAFTNMRFLDVRWRYADGMALQAQGSGWRFENCAWEWNSWTALASAVPGDWSNGGTFVFSGLPVASDDKPMFSRLTFANNGGSKALRPPSNKGAGAIRIELVDFASQLQLADDGCMVETGGPQSAHMTRNWCHDTGKSALRFDGDFASGTANGVMAGNVAWNVSAYMVKGDNHTIANNTGFDGSDISASKAARSRPNAGQGPGSALTNTSFATAKVETRTDPKANARTRFDGNLFDGMGTWKPAAGGDRACADPRAPGAGEAGEGIAAVACAGQWSASNVVGAWEQGQGQGQQQGGVGGGFDIRRELRDAWNRDFRPCPGSLAAMRGAGAYPAWSATDRMHWIPGAKSRRGASQPSPRNATTGAATDADLIFLGAFRALRHTVYFGAAGAGAMTAIATLEGEDNVAHVPAVAQGSALKAGAAYRWRVDANMADGTVLTGPEWSFVTGTQRSCA